MNGALGPIVASHRTGLDDCSAAGAAARHVLGDGQFLQRSGPDGTAPLQYSMVPAGTNG